jgi:hypothetical protein
MSDFNKKVAAEGIVEEKTVDETTGVAVGITEGDKNLKETEFTKRQREIADMEAQRLAMGLQAPKETSAFLSARVEQLEQARIAKSSRDLIKSTLEAGGRPEETTEARAALARATKLSGGAEFNPMELAETKAKLEIARQREAQASQLGTEARGARVQRFQTETDVAAQAARRGGDIRGAQQLEDVSRFTKNFEQFSKTFSKEKAADMALRKTQEEIKQEYFTPNLVDSLTAIGGGGGVSGVDPILQSSRRIEQLNQEQVGLLKILTGQGSEPPPPTFQ